MARASFLSVGFPADATAASAADVVPHTEPTSQLRYCIQSIKYIRYKATEPQIGRIDKAPRSAKATRPTTIKTGKTGQAQ